MTAPHSITTLKKSQALRPGWSDESHVSQEIIIISQVSQKSVIVLHVQRPEDILFKSAILSSAKRLLDPTVEEFITEEAEGLDASDITLLVKSEERQPSLEAGIADIIHKHFAYRSRKAEMSVKKIFKLGWKSLLVSFGFLILMFLIAFAITTFLPENTIVITFRELFIILGWVALWRPADLLLYDWRIYKRRGKLLTRVAHCEVVFQ